MNFFKCQELEALKSENQFLRRNIQYLESVINKLRQDLSIKAFQEFERKKEITKLNKTLRRKNKENENIKRRSSGD